MFTVSYCGELCIGLGQGARLVGPAQSDCLIVKGGRTGRRTQAADGRFGGTPPSNGVRGSQPRNTQLKHYNNRHDKIKPTY